MYVRQVSVVEYKERRHAKDMILVHIICERNGHKGILLGRGGSAMKQLATTARAEIESFLGVLHSLYSGVLKL